MPYGCLASVLLMAAISVASAQDPAPPKPEPFRSPVQGVLKDATPRPEVDESNSRHDVIELLAVDPGFDWAKNATFRRDVYNLRFEFKPLRMIWVDMPQPSGKLQRKAIHYLVYSVTNVPVADQKSDPPRYGWMHPVPDPNDPYKHKIEYQDRPIRFVPEFLLESPEYHKAYSDRVIPVALAAIRAREDRLPPTWSRKDKTSVRPPLRSTVEMATEITVGQTLWGVATWEEIDPKIDRFVIYVQGLTNAYRWRDLPEKYRPGAEMATYRKMFLKTLRLNFWRPGDEYYPKEAEIRRGYPGGPDYDWIYLPSLSQSQ
jgi:hypothetical protein